MFKAQNYFPLFARKGQYLNNLLGAINTSDDKVYEAIQDLALQFNVSTATWGLSIFEDELGILGVADKPLNERRQLILSKLRGAGTVNATMIRSIVDSYVPGCEVEIVFDNSTITIKFIDKKGVPSNIADCENSINEIIPCHLGLEFVYLFNTWKQVEDMGNTWGHYETLGKTWMEVSTL